MSRSIGTICHLIITITIFTNAIGAKATLYLTNYSAEL